MLIPYFNGMVYYIQYWPESDKAQVGTKQLTTTITEYADKLVETYKKIPYEKIK